MKILYMMEIAIREKGMLKHHTTVIGPNRTIRLFSDNVHESAISW